MLKGIPHILSPDLLHALQAMGHGDEITIVDGNYPGDSAGPRLIRADGHSGTDVLEAILSADAARRFRARPGGRHAGRRRRRPAPAGRRRIRAASSQRYEPKVELTSLERFAFYKRANAGYAMVQTGEQRLYGNIILKKGVIRPDG